MILHPLYLALFSSLGRISVLVAADNILSKLDLLRYDQVCLSSPDKRGQTRQGMMLGLCRESPGHHYTRDKPPGASDLPGRTEKKCGA